jgi:hypothetical protein
VSIFATTAAGITRERVVLVSGGQPLRKRFADLSTYGTSLGGDAQLLSPKISSGGSVSPWVPIVGPTSATPPRLLKVSPTVNKFRPAHNWAAVPVGAAAAQVPFASALLNTALSADALVYAAQLPPLEYLAAEQLGLGAAYLPVSDFYFPHSDLEHYNAFGQI